MALLPRVVFEDAQVIVVDKPSGLPSQGTRQGSTPHVHGILAEQRDYVGLHHRLDQPTSGLMVLTRDRRANKALAEALQGGAVKRGYYAVVLGDPAVEGTWNASLDGRRARTHWRRLSEGAGMAVLEVRLATGRTHQIRRHAADAGHPVIGDRRYGGAAGRLWPRLALHARRLSFPHPRTGETVTLQAALPEDVRPLFSRAGLALD
ncbi:MAG: RluA family pseudouridine synthase [Myxococcota bacterium]|nr:RluA family pseudouridine synthase [Myxococcota bacterium]